MLLDIFREAFNEKKIKSADFSANNDDNEAYEIIKWYVDWAKLFLMEKQPSKSTHHISDEFRNHDN